MSQPNKNVIYSCKHYSCTIFILTSYCLYTQIMLLLILIDFQYLQNVVLSFEKDWNAQNHSLSDSHLLMKKSPAAKFPIVIPKISLLFRVIWKFLVKGTTSLTQC